MMYPHTITIINSHNNRGKVEYYFTTIDGVFYQDKQGVKMGTTDHFTDNRGYVQIPHSVMQDYVEPMNWKELSDKSSKWTLQENDFIHKGSTVDINAPKRTIESVENIDYSISIEKHYGVTLR